MSPNARLLCWFQFVPMSSWILPPPQTHFKMNGLRIRIIFHNFLCYLFLFILQFFFNLAWLADIEQDFELLPVFTFLKQVILSLWNFCACEFFVSWNLPATRLVYIDNRGRWMETLVFTLNHRLINLSRSAIDKILS